MFLKGYRKQNNIFNPLPNIAHAEPNKPQSNTMRLQSSAFTEQGTLPKRYTCDGENVSPPLSWSDLPAKTKSLVLIVDDPDAPDPENPKMTWVHWVLYNIPPTATQLPEAVSDAALPQGTLQGKNDWKTIGYGGACPPKGQHRYFHKLYALDIVLPNLNEPTKAKLEEAMGGHVLAHYQLIATYQR